MKKLTDQQQKLKERLASHFYFKTDFCFQKLSYVKLSSGVGSVAECKDELDDLISAEKSNNMVALTKVIAGSFKPLRAYKNAQN